MSIFSWIFGNKKIKTDEELNTSAELSALLAFERDLSNLLDADRFIARRDYIPIFQNYKDLYELFHTLRKSKTLAYFCNTNGIDLQCVEFFMKTYEDLRSNDGAKVIMNHNDVFVNQHLQTDKAYFDHILESVDPAICLDDEQRRVVLSDEDYTLVVAGAGAGKTTTVAAKVKYLVERKGIRPDQILVISFTNKAVGELRDKINKALKIDCPITTFHKTGYAIVRRQDDVPKTIVDQGFMYDVINNYLKGNILENPELVDKLILFFGSYFEAPYEGNDLNDFFNYISKADFSTLRGNMEEYAEQIIDKRTGKCLTIAYETLRSAQEVRIANFLYMNGIEYTYEKPYPFNIKGSYKPYTPDFTIEQDGKVAYIEHFGISEDGKNSLYNAEQL